LIVNKGKSRCGLYSDSKYSMTSWFDWDEFVLVLNT